MSNLPIAAMFARDAVERQFEAPDPNASKAVAGGRPAELAAQPGSRKVRGAAAAALRGLADRLDPRPVRTQPARRANPAAHRGSPC
jgi:hypothetical protein